tara:strand:- start:11902 stop:12333 length:432 start_codon:yes stop_codon:yes gene_type:complete
MNTKEIKYNTVEYAASLKLRSDILRVPLGKELSTLDTLGEETQLHFGCFNNHDLIGCVVIKAAANGTRVKLRQMAVEVTSQGKGVGKGLILDIEVFLKEKGYKIIELSARKTAKIFYEKLAYEAMGEFYLEQGIEHVKMQKNI